MKAHILFGFLALALASQAWADGDASHLVAWEDLEEDELTMFPNECNLYELKIPRADVKFTLDTSDFEDCDPTTDLLVASSLAFDGECFETNTTENGSKECIAPGPVGLFGEESVCASWDQLDIKSYSPDEAGGDTQSFTDSICFGGMKYYLALKSTCTSQVNLKVEVEKRKMANTTEAICDNEENYVLNLKENVKDIFDEYKVVIIVASIAVFAALILSVLLCLACCCGVGLCCFTCCKKKSHPTTTIIIQEHQPPATQPLIQEQPPPPMV